MTKSLLLGLAALAALPLSAQQVPDRTVLAAESSAPSKVVLRSARAKAAAALAGTRRLKHLDVQASRLTAPHMRPQSAPARAALPSGALLFEDFEAWDGQDYFWVPEGWAVEHHTDSELDPSQTWGISEANPMMPCTTPDGQYMFGIGYAEVAQDEWLISPAITLTDNQLLSFVGYIDPVFLFDITKVDWNTGDFTEQTISATLKVNVKEEGGEWTEIWDAATPYMGITNLFDLMNYSPSEFQKFNIDLSEFSGKKVQVGFQYVGIDGNSLYIDAIRVGAPELTDVAYLNPIHTLYWGFSAEPAWPSLNGGLVLYPAMAPITWTNNSAYENASYTWTYCDGITADWVTSTNADELTETYMTDYRSEATKKNNFFYPPILTASMEGASDGSYQAPYTYFQAGGTAERTLNDGTEFLAGLLPFNYNTDGLTYLTVEGDFGELDTPITGYNSHTDEFWYSYTFPGETDPSYSSYINGILNFVYPAAAPMTVDGAHVLARGADIDPEVEFSLSLIALTDEFALIPEENTIATATLKAADFTVYDADTKLLYYTLDFTFDEPALLDDSHPGYVVLMRGFHDPRVGYFAPMQSAVPDADQLCFGAMEKYTKYDTEDYRVGYTYLARLESSYGRCFNSFAINLKAHYGWLIPATDKVDIPEDGSAVTVAVDTYFPAESVKISELPGLKADYSGRYDTGLLTLSRDLDAQPANGTITIKAGAHTADIAVDFGSAGIEGAVVGSNADIEAVYTPAGVRVDAASAPGVYIVRRTDGTVSKIVR